MYQLRTMPSDQGIRAMLGFVRTVLWPPSHDAQNDAVEQAYRGLSVLVVERSSGTERSLASISRQAFPSGSVVAAGSVSESVDALTARPVDVAIIELELPDGSGIEVVRESRRLNASTRCVVTTTHDDDDHLTSALAAGASGYLLKNQSDAVLVQQLTLLAKGVLPLAPSVAQRLARHFAAGRSTAEPEASGSPTDGLARLSEREKEVLRLIAKGMQIAEVAGLLEISANTVCSHVKSIYRKRHLSSRAEAALEAQRLGLI